jgi:hypothetical protein
VNPIDAGSTSASISAVARDLKMFKRHTWALSFSDQKTILPLTLSSSCCERVADESSTVFSPNTGFWVSLLSALLDVALVGRTSEIDGRFF